MHRLFISFETELSLTGTQLEDEQAAVEPIFRTLVESLRGRGMNIVGPPADWDSYGWFVEVYIQQARLICMMQRSDQWLLLVFPRRTLIDRLKGRQYSVELQSLAKSISAAVHDAFGIPPPPVRTEVEFRAE